MRIFQDCGLWLVALNSLAVAAVAGEPSGPLPRVYTISPQGLATTQARVRGSDKSLKPAVDRLRREADKALKAGPFSVMDKPRMPPSGDKHDYLSLAPYSWPNPETKDGLPYINRDGQVNPESEKGTDSPVLGHMASTVQTLALAYYLMGDEAYARQATKLLRVWFLDPATRMNPHLEYSQAIPGRNGGRGAGIIEFHVLVDVLDAAGLLEYSSQWTAGDRQAMRAWCAAYLHWLRTSPFGQKEAAARNNHGTWYDVQVAALALYVGQEEVAREVLRQSKQRRIAAQIEPDGSQPRELGRTRSFHYSLFNLQALFTLANLGERVGVGLWHYQSADGRSLRKALDYVAPYADARKPWPHAEMRMERAELGALLRQAATVFGEQPYRQLLSLLPAGDAAEWRAELLNP